MAGEEWPDWLERLMETTDARMRVVKDAPAVKGGGKGCWRKEKKRGWRRDRRKDKRRNRRRE
jgi:hypothetical protein